MKTIIKSIIIPVSFLILFSPLMFTGQELIQTIDTLPDNSAIVTVMRTDSLFFSRYIFLETPYGFRLPGTGAEEETGEGTAMSFVEFPSSQAGCFPRDVCYNQVNGDYYVYCGRKLLRIDPATGDIETSLLVSSTDLLTLQNGKFFNLNPEKKVVVNHNPGNPYIYVTTEDGKLQVVNYVTHMVVNTLDPLNGNADLLCKSSVIFHSGTNAAFWILSDPESSLNRIGKLTGSGETDYSEVDYAINDLEINLEGDSLFISGDQGVYTYDASNLQTAPYHLLQNGNYGAMIYTLDDHLYADRINDMNIDIVDYSNGPPTFSGFEAVYPEVFKFVNNANNHKVYYTGFNPNPVVYGYQIINDINGTSLGYASLENAVALSYNALANKVYVGGRNSMVSIDGSTNQPSQPLALDNSYCYDIGSGENNNSGQVMALQSFSGNAILVDHNLTVDEVINLGGRVIQGCVNEKRHKAYFAVQKTETDSYIMAVNTKTNQIEAELEIPGIMVTGIGCDRNMDSVYFMGDGKVSGLMKNQLYELNGNSNAIEKIWERETNAYQTIEKFLVAPNRKIYLCGYMLLNDTINNAGYFKILDINENYTSDSIILDQASVCISDVKYLDDAVYVASKCSGDIFRIGHDNNFSTPLENLPATPWSVAHNENTGKFYVGTGAEENSNWMKEYIYTNGVFNIQDSFPFGTSTLETSFEEIRCNTLENKVYALTNFKLCWVNLNNYYQASIENKSENMDMLLNQADNRIYLYSYLNESQKLYLKIFDCETDAFTATHDLNLKNSNNLLGELLLTGVNGSFAFDETLNKLFTSNLSFSNVLAYHCYTDQFSLQQGWNWKSFPRLERFGNIEASSIEALDELVVPWEPGYLKVHDKNPDIYLQYINNSWVGQLDEVQSTLGYKMQILWEEPPSNAKLLLHGKQLSTSTEIELEADADNWTGYFVEESQYPWDAFPEEVYNLKLTSIKSQYWEMTKINGKWYTNWLMVTPIRYGDMLVLRVAGHDPVSFVWNDPAESEEQMNFPMTDYFSFEEKADYVPFYILTDPESDIEEIAVMAGGECKGATVRLPGDTLVEVNGYLEGVAPGTTLEFETWNGYKSTPVMAGSYVVYNEQTGNHEKRKIFAGEKGGYYLVSLRPGEQYVISGEAGNLQCDPNPVNKGSRISFRINTDTEIRLEVLDLNGTVVHTVLQGSCKGGYYEAGWPEVVNREGVYFLRLTSENGAVHVRKVVIIK